MLRAIGVGGLVLVIATGVGGVTNSVRNPGPVLVWVVFIGERVGRSWALEQFDAFTTYNRLISSIGPFDLDPERGPGWRGWLRSLPGLPELPGMAGFVIMLIGAVTFHGMSTASWFESAFGGFGRSPGGRTVLLVMTVAMVGTAYWSACRLAARQAGASWSTSEVARRFTHCLVPIATAFLFAHYFTVVVFEGQLLGSTMSDPFGLGWNLLGMAGRPVDFTVLSPTTVWWIQVASIAAGHVSALLLVHDRSLADFGPAGVRRGYPFVALVIVLAWAGLTILAADQTMSGRAPNPFAVAIRNVCDDFPVRGGRQ